MLANWALVILFCVDWFASGNARLEIGAAIRTVDGIFIQLILTTGSWAFEIC